MIWLVFYTDLKAANKDVYRFTVALEESGIN